MLDFLKNIKEEKKAGEIFDIMQTEWIKEEQKIFQ